MTGATATKGTIPTKYVGWGVTTLLTLCGLIVTLHLTFLKPSLLKEAQDETMTLIQAFLAEHLRNVHPDAVTHGEFTLWREQLNRRLDTLATEESVQGLRRELLAKLEALQK